MKCTECNGRGEVQYGDERELCIACHGAGIVSQATINNTIREYPDRADPWPWGKSE